MATESRFKAEPDSGLEWGTGRWAWLSLGVWLWCASCEEEVENWTMAESGVMPESLLGR